MSQSEKALDDYIKPEQMPVFFIELAQDGSILRSNSYSKELTGADLIGQNFRQILVDFNSTIDPFALAESNASGVLTNVNTFTGLPQSLYCNFVRNGDKVEIIGTVNPMEQEQMRMQVAKLNQQLGNMTRELQKANAELDHLNKLKSQFLGMAAHDLRKPVGVVQSFSELILDEVDDTLSKDHRDFIERIHRNSVFMRRLIDDFLDVAIIESGKFATFPEPVSLEEILEHVLEIVLVHSRRKNVPLSVADGARDIGLFVDAPKIEQVLINLISNAIEHSPQDAPIKVYWNTTPEQIAISVEDNGVGIPKSLQKRLFNPYETGMSKKTGGEKSTGLGLVISRKIAEAHNGNLAIESDEGGGATFTLTLPLN